MTLPIPHIHPQIRLSVSQYEYIDSCARIRGITRYRLITKLMRTIASDQLVLSILDDEASYRTEYAKNKLGPHKKHEEAV